MTKLKLGPIPDDKPVKLTVDLPAELHRDLIAYGEILGRGRNLTNTKTLVSFKPNNGSFAMAVLYMICKVNGLVLMPRRWHLAAEKESMKREGEIRQDKILPQTYRFRKAVL